MHHNNVQTKLLMFEILGGKNITYKPTIGFCPATISLGETLPQLKIAKKYVESGGKAIFFSHRSGWYTYLIKENGFKVVNLKEVNWSKLRSTNKKKMTLEKQLLIPYDRTNIEGVVESEIDAFKNEGIDLIVSSFTPTCCISSRVLKIPLVVLASGTASSLYYRSGYATFPENYENVFTKMLPTFFKKYITRWMLLNNKVLVKDFNKVAKKYNIRTFKTLNEIFESGHTLFCDDINFLGIKPTKEFPIENFIGPILPDYSFDKDGRTIDSETENHLKKNNRSILVTLGSSGTKQIFLEILNVLNKTNYNVIAVYADIVKSNEIPDLNDNILLKKFVPSIKKVNEMVDLAIIHGGRGTIYTAAYSGKPIIGIPMHIEQQYNIDCLVRHGIGLRLSKKFFKPKNFLQAINEIFDNYDTFFKNAQKLSAKLQKTPMEDKALQILMRILDEKNKLNKS